jgi:hypothetical protein
MDAAAMRAGWAGVVAEVEQELVAWRQAHPKATLTELESAVQAAVQRLRERYLTDLVHASAAVDLRAASDQPKPACPHCGGSLEARGGPKERQVLTARQAHPLRVRRTEAVCSACGVGLFPPG